MDGMAYPPNDIGEPRRMPRRLEALCIEKGLKMTGQRRVIAKVLSDADDHPDVEQVYRRAAAIDPRISIATVYRTVKLFEEANILTKLDFGDGRARYVIEFHNEEIERLQAEIARKLGYRLIGHRLELYGVPIDTPEPEKPKQ